MVYHVNNVNDHFYLFWKFLWVLCVLKAPIDKRKRPHICKCLFHNKKKTTILRVLHIKQNKFLPAPQFLTKCCFLFLDKNR